MQFLTLVYYIDHLVRLIVFFTLHKSREIRRIIQGCSVRFQDHTRRNFFLVCLFLYINNKSTFIIAGISLIL